MFRRNSQSPGRLKKARQQFSQLRSCSENELLQLSDYVRERIRSEGHLPQFEREPVITTSLALAMEATRRELGFELFDNQLQTACAMIDGCIAEMQTGEGKTVSAVPTAVYQGFTSRGVHIATPNTYLAERDFEQLKPVYESLGISVGLLSEDATTDEKSAAYNCDVVYGPGYEFGFDYLRDQLRLKERENLPLGQNLLDELTGSPAFFDGHEASPSTLTATRGTAFSIVDEADNVLIDDAVSPLVLSGATEGEPADADAIRFANKLVDSLEPEAHFVASGPRTGELTELGQSRIHAEDLAIPVKQLVRPWKTYIETALRAEHTFTRDIHYVLQDSEIKIVDGSTGRIFEDRTWQSGLHQAIEAKEGIPLTNESLPLAQITKQRFFGLYDHLGGMTGTAANCRHELKAIYGLDVRVIPLRRPSRRVLLPIQAFANREAKFDAIARDVLRRNQAGQPVLVGTRTIAESLAIAECLVALGIDHELLNGMQTAEEAEVVGRAGEAGAVTIATNLAGRGTDIKLSERAAQLGGLHVIVSECHESARIDRQLIGRCARQGDPGSAQIFVAADDWLFEIHSPWITNAMRRMGVAGESSFDWESKIRKIQQGVERIQYAKRLQLFHQAKEQAALSI